MRKQANDNSYLFQRELEVINEVVARQPDLDLTFSRVFPTRQLNFHLGFRKRSLGFGKFSLTVLFFPFTGVSFHSRVCFFHSRV